MKIAVPVDEKKLDSAVCVSFGRAPYFLYYNTDTKAEEYIENAAASAPGGAGITAAQKIVDEKALALLTIRCGQNAAEVLNTAGIKIYKTKHTSAKENIEAFEGGNLDELSEIHPGYHGHK